MNKIIRIVSVALCVFACGALHATSCQAVDVSYLQYEDTSLGEMTTDNSEVWTWNTYHYAMGNKQGGVEGNLFTPALNLAGAESVTLSFTHTHKFAGTPAEEMTLWVTADYQGSYASSTWHQLTIDPYGTNNDWSWVDVTIQVPVAYAGANTVFCFKYISTATHYAKWEVKNVHVVSTCPESNDAPVALPDVGDGRLKIFAQNLQNYYYNYNTGRGDYTPEQRAEKTRKIVDAMLWVDADIFALCEVEAKPIVLQQLTDSMNARVEGNPYVAVSDGIDEDWSESNTNNIKSGFIYRSDKVKTVGVNHAATTAYYYKNTLRIQVFEELSSGERFTVSMNHFKAKDNTEDAGHAKRVINANQLLQGLGSYASDPDILILGDLNCEVGEEPLTIIENAGFEEQLIRYNGASEYSHCYNGGELIDHVYANASMAGQITGAGVFHISTACGSDASANRDHRYSDHDPYVVGLNPESTHATECEEINDNFLATGGTGLGGMYTESVSGDYNWQYNSQYGAKCVDKGGEDWLLTPAYDLSMAGTVTLSFDHTIGYAIDMPNQQTLWVTSDYSDVAGSEWKQLTIPTYPSGTNWTFVHATVNVPLTKVGANTVFGFKYAVPNDESTKKPTWEIKNLQVSVTCEELPSGVEQTCDELQPTKLLEDGNLYILLPDGRRYTVIGVSVQ